MDQADTTEESGQARRRHERVPLEKPAQLHLDRGVEARGRTRNAAVGGVLLAVEESVGSVTAGQEGVLRVEVEGNLRDFPVRVVHVASGMVGLSVTRGLDEFGMAMTLSVFQEMMTRIDAPVPEHCPLTVALMVEASEREVRVRALKVGIRHLVCEVVAGTMSTELGQSVRVYLRQSGHEPLELRGVTGSFLPDLCGGIPVYGRPRGGRLTADWLDRSAEEERRLQELIGRLHQLARWDRVKEKTASLRRGLAVFSAAPPERPSVQEQYAQFSAFFKGRS